MSNLTVQDFGYSIAKGFATKEQDKYQQFLNVLEKGGKRAVEGEERMFGGRKFRKDSSQKTGWKYIGGTSSREPSEESHGPLQSHELKELAQLSAFRAQSVMNEKERVRYEALKSRHEKFGVVKEEGHIKGTGKPLEIGIKFTTPQIFAIMEALKNQVIENEDNGSVSKAEQLENIIQALETEYYSREDRGIYSGQ